MLYKFKQGNLWGMIDEKGLIVGKFSADIMGLFNESMANMNIHGCIGYINKDFQVVIEPKYGLQSSPFNEGLAAVCTPKIVVNKRYGFIDKKGQIVIDFIYEAASNFNEDLAVVLLGHKYGTIDKSGKLIVDNKYDWINGFKEGRSFFRQDNLWEILDSNGNEVLKSILEEDDNYEEHYENQMFSEGYAIVNRNGKYGYINNAGIIVTDIDYDYATPFKEGVANIKIGKNYYIIDKEFNKISELKCEHITGFCNGIAKILIDGKWGIVDKEGNIRVKPKYEYILDYNNGLISTILDGKYGYIDLEGREIFRAKDYCKKPYYTF
jgi:subtilisin family serine protease